MKHNMEGFDTGVINASGIVPLGHRVLVLPYEIEEKSAGGVIVTIAVNKEREEMAQVRGVVVSVGPNCWEEYPKAWAIPGDHVMFGKYAGAIMPGNDGKKYRLVNDLDLVALIQNNEQDDERAMLRADL